jgi:hypothetical protein
MARVPASESTGKRIAELLGGKFKKSELMREGRLIVEESLTAEASERLGRGNLTRCELVATSAGNETS